MGEGAATDERIAAAARSAIGEGYAPVAAGTPRLLRAINERSIIELLRRGGPASRAQVARDSGLSKPTVSLALGGLVQAGLAREVGRSSGGKGPAAVLYELNPHAGWVVGIDVGRVWVRAAIAGLTGELVARRAERARVRSAKTLIAQIGRMAHEVAGEAGLSWDQVTHATVGSPGVVDPSRGSVELAPNLPGWGRRGLVEAVRQELGTGVTFDNDVNLAALGERTRGLGRGVDDFVFLWVGTGIGLGIVLGGALYRGAHGYAGEIAYAPLGADPHDPATHRRGALEEAVAAGGLVRAARALGLPPPLTPKKIFALAHRGDPRAERVLDEAAARLAMVIATVAPILDPALVIVGGGIGLAEEALLARIERELRQISPFRPRIARSELGEEAVLHGAVATALAVAQDQLFPRARSHEQGGLAV
jgi:predicted NBD/HSP70 family sugar kinase